MVLQQITGFTPGPVAIKCLALAKEAVNHAEANPECTKHVYRSQHRSNNREVWKVGLNTNGGKEWIMHVDCAGFVRNVLETSLKHPFTVALSDRSFMRAKDFFTFFEHLPSLSAVAGSDLNDMRTSDSLCWSRVDDLRMILPGDIIAYRHKGQAAGGAAFLETTSLHSLFKSLKVKHIYDEVKEKEGRLVHRNIALDEGVEEWTESLVQSLTSIGIESLDALKGRLEDNCVNNRMRSQNVDMAVLREALHSKAHDTGHVMFAAGRAENVENTNQWRIPVYHSTSSGKYPGVQRGYKTFTRTKHGRWLWEGDTNILGVPDEVLAARLLS